MKKVFQKQNDAGSTNRRIACLLLTLVLTITGLPMMGGVETVQAQETYPIVISYSENNRGFTLQGMIRQDAPTTLVISGYGIISYDGLSAEDRTRLQRLNITELIIEATSNTIIQGWAFSYLGDSLTTIEVKYPYKLSGASNFYGLNQLTKIILPNNCPQQYRDKINDNISASRINPAVENSYLLTVVNGTIDEQTMDDQGVCKKTFYDSDFSRENSQTVTLTPNTIQGQHFKGWSVSYPDSRGTEIISGSALTNSTSGIHSLSFSKTDMTKGELYVTAKYLSAESVVSAQTLFEKAFVPAIEGYRTRKQETVTQAALFSEDTLRNELTYVVQGVTAMGDSVSSAAIQACQITATKESTVWENGQIQFDLRLEVVNKNNESFSSTRSFTITIQKQSVTDIHVRLIDATFPDGSSEKNFPESGFSMAPNNTITTILTPAAKNGYTFTGWNVSPENGGAQIVGNTLSLTASNPWEPMLVQIEAQYRGSSGTSGGGGVPTGSTTEKEEEKEAEKDKDKDPEADADPDPEKEQEDKGSETDPPVQTVTKKKNSYQVTTGKTTATISVKDLSRQMAQNKNSKLVIKCGNATASFDKTAVQSILDQAKKIGSSNLKFVCKTDAKASLNSAQKKALKKKTVVGCYHVYLKCGNKLIKDFGKGKVTIKVPIKLKSGQKAKYIKLYHINSKGRLTKMSASSSGSELTYRTTHFSFFCALHEKTTTATKKQGQ